MKRLILVATGVLALAACTPKKMMLSESMLPGHDKVVKESIKTVGSKKDAQLNNYYMQVCDVNAGKATNCKTTLVLENIVDYNVNTNGMVK